MIDSVIVRPVGDTEPDLTVVIPTWNAPLLLGNCLKSIAKHSTGCRIQVVIFVNGNDRQTTDVALGYSDHYPLTLCLSDHNRGFAEACSVGATHAEAPFILFLNNDAEIAAPLVEGVRYLKAHPSVGACQGPILMADGRHIDSVGSLLTRSGFLAHVSVGATTDALPPGREVFSLKGAALWLRVAALDGSPPFDADAFAYFEESDLCWRLWVTGWSIRYVEWLPIVRHQIGATSTRLDPSIRQFHSFKNRLRAILRYNQSRSLPRMLLLHLAWCVASSVNFAASGRWEEAQAVWKAWTWNLHRLSVTQGERRLIATRRKITDQELLQRAGTRMTIWQAAKQQRVGDRAEAIALRSTTGETLPGTIEAAG